MGPSHMGPSLGFLKNATVASTCFRVRFQLPDPSLTLRVPTTKTKSFYRDLSEGRSTKCLRTLVPNTIKSMVFGTRDLKYLVLGPLGFCTKTRSRMVYKAYTYFMFGPVAVRSSQKTDVFE